MLSHASVLFPFEIPIASKDLSLRHIGDFREAGEDYDNCCSRSRIVGTGFDILDLSQSKPQRRRRPGEGGGKSRVQ